MRADISCFFDRPGDELGTLGVVTEIEPREDELRVKMGLGDCGLHIHYCIRWAEELAKHLCLKRWHTLKR